MTSPFILVVDDEPDIRSLLKEILEDEGYAVGVAESGEAARKARKERRPDLVLLDIWMPDTDGITLLKEWRDEADPAPPVIIMSGHGTVETAVEATRLGAHDFIEKPLSLGKLLVTVQRALESYHLKQENVGLRRQLTPLNEPVGRSQVIQQLRDRAKRIAQHDTVVLLQGEPGSGKGTLARYIHAQSPRVRGPMIEVGVASLSPERVGLELFGCEEGDSVQFGLLERANGGILFIDDIADLDLSVQARLLGAIENRRYFRVGGGEVVHIDVRVVAATRYDLAERVRRGLFRDDLFYQLNVVPISVPALREHLEDVPELLKHAVSSFVDHDHLPYRTFTVAAQNRLRNYAWPGNIRELQNLVQRLLIVGTGAEVDLLEVEAALGDNLRLRGGGEAIRYELPLREARDHFEKLYFVELLRRYEGSINKVAQHAAVERTHLYRKLRSLNIDAKTISGKG